MAMGFFLTLLGSALLYLGAESLVRGASKLAFVLGVSPLVVGLTVVSIGTSLPEATATLAAQLGGNKGDIALGNIIGSNISNIGLILGVVLMISPIEIQKSLRRREMPIFLAVTGLIYLAMAFGSIGRLVGAVLLVAFIAYLLLQYHVGRKSYLLVEDVAPHREKMYVDGLLIALGIVLLVVGGNLLVEGAIKIGAALGVSERSMGLTFVALGTSLPELAASSVAALRRNHGLAIGNVIGSCVFNILFVLGGVSLISPITFSSVLFYVDAPLLLYFSFLLGAIILFSHTMRRWQGIGLLLSYALYLIIFVF
ncbi:MAG: calcium/sodium antiporter [Chlamydiota bacterium]